MSQDTLLSTFLNLILSYTQIDIDEVIYISHYNYLQLINKKSFNICFNITEDKKLTLLINHKQIFGDLNAEVIVSLVLIIEME